MNSEYIIDVSKQKLSKYPEQIMIIVPEKYLSSIATFFIILKKKKIGKNF